MRTISRLLAATLFLTATAASAATVRERFDRTYNFTPGHRFALSNTNGSVSIASWDRPQVRIEAEKVVKASGEERAREVMKKVAIQVAPNANGLAVKTITPDLGDNIFSWLAGMSAEASVEYRITVPRTLNLAITTVNGSVTAADVTGELKVETINGRIELLRAGGRLALETVNGRILAQMRELGAAGPHSVDTTNGAVKIELPPNARAELDVKTLNGTIRSDFPVTISGDDNRLESPMNGGGPALVVRTTNGSVTITKQL